MESSKMNSVAVGMLVLGLIVGFFIGWYAQKSAHSNDEGAEIAEVMDETGTSTEAGQDTTVITSTVVSGAIADITVEGTGSATASDQKAGKSVVVSKVVLDTTGWITVREEKADGSMGNILGAKLFAKGTHNDVKITLLRATTAGKTYHVALYKDNGDAVFKKGVDSLIVADGKAVTASFKATR